MKIIYLLFLLLFTGNVFANQYDCGENANGLTPRSGSCINTNTETGPTGTPDCDIANHVNPSASDEFIIGTGTCSTSDFENTAYGKIYICPENTGCNVSFKANGNSRPGGKLVIQGYHEDSGNGIYDHTVKPKHKAVADQSIVQRINCNNTVFSNPDCDSIWIKDLMVEGPSAATSGITVKNAKDVVIQQIDFMTWPHGISGGGLAFQCTGASEGIYLQYPYFEGVEMWDDSSYDNKDTHGANFGKSCRKNIHVTEWECSGHSDCIQYSSAPTAGDTAENMTIQFGTGYGDRNYMTCDGHTENTVTITRSGSTVTVSDTAHGFSVGDDVLIRGADQEEYNNLHVITATTTNSYDYEITGTPTTPATGTILATEDEEVCWAAENILDLKLCGKSGDPMVVDGNYMFGARPQGPAVGGGNSRGAGGSNAAEGSLTVAHLQCAFLQYTRNWHVDYSNGMTGAGAGADSGFPKRFLIAKNFWIDQKFRNEDGHANVVSSAIRSVNWNDVVAMQNFFNVLSTENDIEDTLRLGNDTDYECNIIDGGASNSYSGTTTGVVEDNGYANSSTQISGDLDPHTATITMQEKCWIIKPHTGPLITTGPYAGHYGEEVCHDVLLPSSSTFEDLCPQSPDPAKGL